MTNPCQHCGDTTDHAKPEAFCACMAGLEGWTKLKKAGYLGIVGVPKHRKSLALKRGYAPEVFDPIPDYFNDPAQTVRGVKWLLAGDFYMSPGGRTGAPVDITIYTDAGSRDYSGDTPGEAIARAWHAAKLAEWVVKQGGEG